MACDGLPWPQALKLLGHMEEKTAKPNAVTPLGWISYLD